KPAFADNLRRLQGLFYYKDKITQEAIVDEELYQYKNTEYFKDDQTSLVLLPMDLEFMEAGKPSRDYLDQLKTLKSVKKEYGDRVKIFLHTDPRRIKRDPDFLPTHLKLFGEIYD